ncbi:MAG: malto-oligosyltrehalose synthase, partial [Gemmatimonadaceae bacterium]
ASWFDVDWNAPARGLKGRVLIPILGDELDAVIARGEITLALEHGRFRIHYFDQNFPLDPATLPRLIEPAAEDVKDAEYAEEAENAELAGIVRDLSALPPRLSARRALVERRQIEAPEVLRRLDALISRSAAIREALERAARDFATGDGGAARLASLLDAQVYALVFWRRAEHEINYRRFFDINELVALRMEDPSVFGATHRRIIQWVKDGQLDGLRIDHVDGLRNPRDYLARLRAAVRQVLPESDIPIWVEKILSGAERLRDDWPVEGTTGYDFLNQVNNVLVDAAGAEALTQIYTHFTGQDGDFAALAQDCKRMVANEVLGSDLNQLTALLLQIAEHHRRHRDYPRPV